MIKEYGSRNIKTMPRVNFTGHLKRFFPGLTELEVEGQTISSVIAEVNRSYYPGLQSHLVDEQGALRPHVNIFLAGAMIRDRKTLQDVVAADDEILIMQALSGG